MPVLDEVKKLIGLTDNLQDAQLRILEQLTTQQLQVLLDVDVVPPKYEFIITSVVVARFNRIGNEGMQSYSQEGESVSYSQSDFDPYRDIIDHATSTRRRGNIVFFDN